jgi:CheY-like chemotaxis protein
MIKLLHIDDNPDHLEITKRFLLSLTGKIEIFWARSAREGLVLLRNGAIDCILSDYKMPEFDGLDLLGALRESGDDTPFILYSGESGDELKTEAFRAGAHGFCTKDVNAAHFRGLLERILVAVEEREPAMQAADAVHPAFTQNRADFSAPATEW